MKAPQNKRRFVIRSLASLYVLYLAAGLIKDFSKVPENQRMLIGALIGLFILVPCWILYGTYCDWKKAKILEAEEPEPSSGEPEPPSAGEEQGEAELLSDTEEPKQIE